MVFQILGSVLIVAVIVASVVWLAWRLRRRRADVFTQFARRHHLKIAETETTPVVSGIYRGRPFRLEAMEVGSDDEAGIVEARLSIGLNHVPEHLFAETTAGVIGAVVQMADGRDPAHAESQFDRDVLIKPEQDADVESYWTEFRKSIFLDFMNTTDCDPIRIRDGSLEVEFRSVVATLQHVEQLADEVYEVAESLDAAPEGSRN